MIHSILVWDGHFSEFLATLIPHNQFFNLFFSFLSLEGNWILIWAIAVLILFFTEVRQDKRFLAYFMISFFATAILVNIILKQTFQRSRPWVAKQLEASTCPKDYSFPSGHASGAFAGATILAAFDRKRAKYYYITAFFISFSRIYLLCHYFLDVTIGGFIGYLISKLTLKLKIGTDPIV